jgi:hypothetical protein
MLSELPGWVVDDVTSVRREVAEWADMSVAERWRLARVCCRDAMWAARAGGMRERILDRVEPPSRDVVEALERLRLTAGWGR